MMIYTHKQAVKNYQSLKKYENVYDKVLDERYFYIIRFDGVKMTKAYLNNKDKKLFLLTFRTMINIFMKQNLDFKICYSYADELSLYIPPIILKRYDYRMEKLISIYSSKITAAFYLAAYETGLELKDTLCSFDARLISLPNFYTIIKYIEARQMFNITRHLLILNNQYLHNKKLLQSDKIIEALAQKGFIYEMVNRHERYGILWVDSGYVKCFEFKGDEKYLIELLEKNCKKEMVNQDV